MLRLAAAVAALVIASCAKPPPDRPEPRPLEPAASLSELNQRLLEIAREYQGYGIVDNKFSWVQTLCKMPLPPARISESDDGATHGGRIYLLYAKNWKAYVSGIGESQPVGQVLVKEAWEPKPVAGDDDRGVEPTERGSRMHPAKRDGHSYTAGDKHGLFIMFKDDQGWHYGTVAPDGKRVLQSGRISSCVKCHQDAKPDSLYGLPGRPQDR